METIETTLRKLVEEGLQKRSILAGLNSLQFRLKEGDFGRWPKGLMYGLDLFDSWLYDDNAAFLLLETQDAMDELYKKAEGNYFEQLIKECLIDNSAKYGWSAGTISRDVNKKDRLFGACI